LTKFTIDTGSGGGYATRAPVMDVSMAPHHREGATCDIYAPGHQLHYKHQGAAVHTPSLTAKQVLVDETWITLVLDDGTERVWRHHDPDRLNRVVELLRGSCVVYPDAHALRVGPYWFNCATEVDAWEECSLLSPGVLG
jgi:hypothetical protein